MEKSVDEIDFEKSGGLIPVIVQDSETKDVLTLAYSNKESLELTKKTGNFVFEEYFLILHLSSRVYF
jgi:phosphoribosyl-AMP cyclohydrolase